MLNLYITDILQKPTSTEPNKQRKSGTWRLCKVDSPVPPEGKEENILHNVLTSTDRLSLVSNLQLHCSGSPIVRQVEGKNHINMIQLGVWAVQLQSACQQMIRSM